MAINLPAINGLMDTFLEKADLIKSSMSDIESSSEALSSLMQGVSALDALTERLRSVSEGLSMVEEQLELYSRMREDLLDGGGGLRAHLREEARLLESVGGDRPRLSAEDISSLSGAMAAFSALPPSVREDASDGNLSSLGGLLDTIEDRGGNDDFIDRMGRGLVGASESMGSFNTSTIASEVQATGDAVQETSEEVNDTLRDVATTVHESKLREDRREAKEDKANVDLIGILGGLALTAAGIYVAYKLFEKGWDGIVKDFKGFGVSVLNALPSIVEGVTETVPKILSVVEDVGDGVSHIAKELYAYLKSTGFTPSQLGDRSVQAGESALAAGDVTVADVASTSGVDVSQSSAGQTATTFRDGVYTTSRGNVADANVSEGTADLESAKRINPFTKMMSGVERYGSIMALGLWRPGDGSYTAGIAEQREINSVRHNNASLTDAINSDSPTYFYASRPVGARNDRRSRMRPTAGHYNFGGDVQMETAHKRETMAIVDRFSIVSLLRFFFQRGDGMLSGLSKILERLGLSDLTFQSLYSFYKRYPYVVVLAFEATGRRVMDYEDAFDLYMSWMDEEDGTASPYLTPGAINEALDLTEQMLSGGISADDKELFDTLVGTLGIGIEGNGNSFDNFSEIAIARDASFDRIRTKGDAQSWMADTSVNLSGTSKFRRGVDPTNIGLSRDHNSMSASLSDSGIRSFSDEAIDHYNTHGEFPSEGSALPVPQSLSAVTTSIQNTEIVTQPNSNNIH